MIRPTVPCSPPSDCCRGLYTLAPGVVLQKAPGHSLDVGRPALAALLIKEDRPAVAAQVRAFHRLPADVHVIVAHDPVALAQDLKAGLYREGFSGL